MKYRIKIKNVCYALGMGDDEGYMDVYYVQYKFLFMWINKKFFLSKEDANQFITRIVRINRIGNIR